MAIVGAHSIVYSRDAEADRSFLRDVIGLPHVDVGQGWLIFGLPPAEVAVHPSDDNDLHEFYLMCDDVAAFVQDMTARGIACAPVMSLGWGALTSVALPGGGKLGVYQPRHERPPAAKGKPGKLGKRVVARPKKPAQRKAAKNPKARGARR